MTSLAGCSCVSSPGALVWAWWAPRCLCGVPGPQRRAPGRGTRARLSGRGQPGVEMDAEGGGQQQGEGKSLPPLGWNPRAQGSWAQLWCEVRGHPSRLQGCGASGQWPGPSASALQSKWKGCGCSHTPAVFWKPWGLLWVNAWGGGSWKGLDHSCHGPAWLGRCTGQTLGWGTGGSGYWQQGSGGVGLSPGA